MEKIGIINTVQLMSELKSTAKGLHVYTMNNIDIIKKTIDYYNFIPR